MDRPLPTATESGEPRRRGQVGIGTLVVLVAMILIAATTVGVLFETAGFLRGQSGESAEGARQSVTDRVRVVAAVGTVITDAPAVGVVNVTVAGAPGGTAVDLRNLTANWVGPTGSYRLVAAGVSSDGADGTFGLTVYKEEGESTAPVLDDPTDRVVLTFDVGSDDGTEGSAFGEELAPGTSVRLILTTRAGASVTRTLVVPASLSGDDAVYL